MQTSISLPRRTGYVRVRQICGDPLAAPPIPAIIPIGESTWWRWIQEGRAPKGLKLSPGVTVWRADDVYALAEKMGGAE